VECYVCRLPIATPPGGLAPGELWIHPDCHGNRPTIAELVMAFLTAVPNEVFCVRCLGGLVGVASAEDMADEVAALAARLVIEPGTCARCAANEQVLSARLEPRARRVRSQPAAETGPPQAAPSRRRR
jgi:hypothetical protein